MIYLEASQGDGISGAISKSKTGGDSFLIDSYLHPLRPGRGGETAIPMKAQLSPLDRSTCEDPALSLTSLVPPARGNSLAEIESGKIDERT